MGYQKDRGYLQTLLLIGWARYWKKQRCQSLMKWRQMLWAYVEPAEVFRHSLTKRSQSSRKYWIAVEQEVRLNELARTQLL